MPAVRSRPDRLAHSVGQRPRACACQTRVIARQDWSNCVPDALRASSPAIGGLAANPTCRPRGTPCTSSRLSVIDGVQHRCAPSRHHLLQRGSACLALGLGLRVQEASPRGLHSLHRLRASVPVGRTVRRVHGVRIKKKTITQGRRAACWIPVQTPHMLRITHGTGQSLTRDMLRPLRCVPG